MTEIVVLQDVVASYGSLWIRCANTQGLPSVQIKDRFREQGFGEGAEELEIEGIDLSPVSGASRIFVRRAANNTKAEVHRLGAVMLQTNAPSPNHFMSGGDASGTTTFTYPPAPFTINSGVSNATGAMMTVTGTESPQAVKRGRGRPKGAKNKPKPPLQRVSVPAWPGV